MGNCMETCMQKQQEEDQIMPQQKQKQKGDERGGEIRFVKEDISSGKDGKLRIKLVMTKEELEMLMIQLQDKGGQKSLEQVVEEIQKGRGGKLVLVEEGWKPALESIMECPEVVEEMDRSIDHSSEPQKAAPLVSDSVQTFFSGSKASKTLGGKASEQPPRTPVSKEEIDAILLGGCI